MTNTNEEKADLNIEEAIEYTGLSDSTIRRLIRDGKVSSEFQGRALHITKESLDKVLQEKAERKKQTPKPLSIPDLLPIQAETTLDKALENMKTSIFKVSEYLTKKAEALQPGEYDFPVLTLSMQKMTDSLSKMVQLAPFLAFRYDFEAMEKFKTWVTEHPHYSPEKKREALEMASTYQEYSIKRTEEAAASGMVSSYSELS